MIKNVYKVIKSISLDMHKIARHQMELSFLNNLNSCELCQSQSKKFHSASLIHRPLFHSLLHRRAWVLHLLINECVCVSVSALLFSANLIDCSSGVHSIIYGRIYGEYTIHGMM